MQEFSTGDGFREVTNFIYETKNDRLQMDGEVLASLGYKLMERLFTDSASHSMETYENSGNTMYKYVVLIRNNVATEYVSCRTFFDFLEFMRRYLPVLEKLNTLAASAIPWQRGFRRHSAGEEAIHQ